MRRFLVSITTAAALLAFAHNPAQAEPMPDARVMHVGDSHSEDCNGVSATFVAFPAGSTDILISSDVGYTMKAIIGLNGSVSATWSELGIDTTQGGLHSVRYDWIVADGIGSYGPFLFDALSCMPNNNAPAITASGVCTSSHDVTFSGSTSGFPDGNVTVGVERGDTPYGDMVVAANGPFSISIDVFAQLGNPTGVVKFGVFAVSGNYSSVSIVEVDFGNCIVQETTTTVAPTTTITPTTTTQPAITPTTTTQPAITTTVASSSNTGSTLPSTGANSYTDDAVRYALGAFLFGIVFLVIKGVRRPARN